LFLPLDQVDAATRRFGGANLPIGQLVRDPSLRGLVEFLPEFIERVERILNKGTLTMGWAASIRSATLVGPHSGDSRLQLRQRIVNRLREQPIKVGRVVAVWL
jgi:hypothetical protein